MIEIPSVEHERVEDGRSAHVMNGGSFVCVAKHRLTENDKREEIENGPGNNEHEWVVGHKKIGFIVNIPNC